MRQAQGTSIPAPIGGWNARDAVDMMGPSDAVVLDNYFPDENEVRLRQGSSDHATGLTDDVETLMSYKSGSASKMFAATDGGNIFEVTSSGAVGSAAISSLSNAQFQYVNFGTSGGNFLWICNGADAPRHYNGSSWATPTISGVTSTTIVNVTAHKTRLFFALTNSLKFGYLPVASVAGTVATFDLASLATKGGSLTAIGTWTRDGGDGADDLAVFITSEGEAIIYAGTDPGDATKWSLVGVFSIGRPIGRRCVEKVGADLIVITENGFIPLSKVLPLGLSAPSVAISDKISGAVKTAAKSFKDTFGWQAILYPKGGFGLFNVPNSTVRNYHQYVVNLTTGAWCKFTGLDGNAWVVHDGSLYFGGVGKVYLADTGTNDSGTAISGSGKTSFQYFGGRGVLKQFTLIRPIIASDGALPVSIGFDVDFKNGTDVYTPSSVTSEGAEWDTATWDTAVWAGESAPIQAWRSVTGVGYNAAVRIRTSTTNQGVTWHATDVQFIPGSGLR
tara:strand:+ start:85 stop:1596 length:1512 start_codon:yes stop_codon:yes gene_type:complete